MGLIKTNTTLSSPSDVTLGAVTVSALVDTGRLHLCILEYVALQRQLNELEKRELILADGKRQLYSYSCSVKVTFHNRSCFVGALIYWSIQFCSAQLRWKICIWSLSSSSEK